MSPLFDPPSGDLWIFSYPSILSTIVNQNHPNLAKGDAKNIGDILMRFILGIETRFELRIFNQCLMWNVSKCQMYFASPFSFRIVIPPARTRSRGVNKNKMKLKGVTWSGTLCHFPLWKLICPDLVKLRCRCDNSKII